MTFHIFEHAEDLIDEIWEAEIPVFKPDENHLKACVYWDDMVIKETIRVLAELVYYSKGLEKNAHSPADWIKANFTGNDTTRYLPGLKTILRRHFPELIKGTAWESSGTSKQAEAGSGVLKLLGFGHVMERKRDMLNYFYIQDYANIPNPPSLELFLKTSGLEEAERPPNYAYLMQTYSRGAVRLERFIALAHLMIAGSQSENRISKTTLEQEYKMQAKIKELKANYLAEYCTMHLGFVKRQKGLEMFHKLNEFTGYEKKHHLALSAIEERLRVGTEQYPSIVAATYKMQRIFTTLGQVLLGGFLATEVIKSLSEWAAVYFHRNPYAFLTELYKLGPQATELELESLLDKFYSFEMYTVYASLLTVSAVIGIALYYRSKNKTLNPQEEGGHGHH